MVENVERFRPKLQFRSFTEMKLAPQSQVQLTHGKTAHHISSQCSLAFRGDVRHIRIKCIEIESLAARAILIFYVQRSAVTQIWPKIVEPEAKVSRERHVHR